MSVKITPAKNEPRLAVITGCTSGIGLATAIGLARLGWRVVGVSRSAERGRRMTEIVRAQTGNPGVTFHAADLALVSETRAVGAQILRQHPAIDLLINNAGGIFSKRQETAEGLERTFALNHIGYFVLTQSLRPALEAARTARIINVASGMHGQGQLKLDNLQMRSQRYSGWQQYANTKLMNVLFTRALAQKLPGHVTSNCLHPGFVATRFGSNNGRLWRLLMRAMMWTAIPPERAAKGVLRLALAHELEGVSGAYFDRGQPAYAAPAGQDDGLADRLWQETEAVLTTLEQRSAA
jgi:NAD(P)-dependent dehydrogenase (short-subunit alcohol dehydrogenase family)